MATMLGGIWLGKQARRDSEQPKAPGPIDPSPKPVMLVKKYALAEFAAIIGIPLAVVGLMLTAFATRDTARQLQLVKAQSQPTFSLTLRKVNPTDARALHSELIVTMSGNAESIVANTYDALIFRGNPGKWPWRLFPYSHWFPATPEPGQVARLTALTTRSSAQLEEQIILASTVTIRYIDLFGEPHVKYYQFSQFAIPFAGVHYPREVTTQQGSECIDLMKTASPRPIFDSKIWQTASRFAREVREDQALNCLGPPIGKLR
jgi:hypothetical protein